MTSARLVGEMSRAFLGCREGYVAVLKIYIDESGIHDGSPVITLGSYLGRPKDWERWTKQWNMQKKPIKVFRSSDCQNLRGEFEGWEKEDKDSFVKNLLPVIAQNNLFGFAVGIRLKAFDAAMAEDEGLREVFPTPYGACLQWMMQSIMMLIERGRSREQIAFFHEENDFSQEAFTTFKYIQQTYTAMGNRMTFTFGGKSKFVPLQAADVLAYESNKRLRNPKGKPRRSFLAIDPHNDLSLGYYGENNIPGLIKQLRVIRRLSASGSLPTESDLFEAFAARFS